MGIVYTVTTCREQLPEVERFVQRNLDAGTDHAFVFLDQPDDRVREFLGDHPNATPIVTDDDYWRGKRPPNLNVRQKVNANLIRTLLAPLDWPSWLFHLDADETLHVDLDRLDGLPAEVQAVRLWPMEAVSTDQNGWDGWYKSLLRSEQLSLLHVLGHLDKASNASYFHGHFLGKVGIRPTLDLALQIHNVTDATGAPVALERHPSLCHLHDAAMGPEEFIQRWTRHANQSGNANFRPAARLLRDSFKALLASPLSETDRRRMMVELYQRTSADPVDLLYRLGYLIQVSPGDQRHQPDVPTQRQQADLDALLVALLHQDPSQFRPRPGLNNAARALRNAAGELTSTHPELARRVLTMARPAELRTRPHAADSRHANGTGTLRRIAASLPRWRGKT